MSAAVWNVAGLVLTLGGVWLLYRYGMPFRIRQDPKGLNFQVNTSDPKIEQENKRYNRLGWCGLGLIVIGTACEIVGPYLAG